MTISENLRAVRSRIRAESVTLIAVSKGHPAEKIEEAIAAGQRDFGENRLQEIFDKWPEIKARHPGVRLHFIGQLQTNKAEGAVEWCDAIHAVGSEKLVDAVARAMEKTSRRPECFIQVNTGEEPQKGGVSPTRAEALVLYARARGLAPAGLMCVPPAGQPAAPHFAFLNLLATRFGLHGLSMGMSGDFETALRFGATHIRVGTAIFGERSSEVRPVRRSLGEGGSEPG